MSYAPSAKFDAAGLAAAAQAASQPLDADLTAVAALSTTSFGRALLALADAGASRTALGLAIGTDVEAYDADLARLAAATMTAKGDLLVWNGSTFTVLPVGSGGQVLMADANAASGVAWDNDFVSDRASLPTSAVAQSFSRMQAFASGQNIVGTTGATIMQEIGVNRGVAINGVVWSAAGTGLTQGATTNHLWSAVCDASGVVKAVSADDTNPVWTGNTDHTINALASWTPTSSQKAYAVLCFAATGGAPVAPTLMGLTETFTGVVGDAPIVCRAGPTGQTTPPNVGDTLTPGAVKSSVVYCRLI